ncbi:MAG: FAD-dependent protein [Clostridiaceae bacterium]
MKIRVQNIKQPLSAGDEQIARLIAAQTGLEQARIKSARVMRRSLDARKKQDIHFLINAMVEVDEPTGKALLTRNDARFEPYAESTPEPLTTGNAPLRGRVVVAGLGPAGLFAALLLARQGYAPLVLERGEPIERRAVEVERYWRTGELNEESNVMFGEGGAGTFSDGKLTSRSKDSRGDTVLKTLVQFGAPEEIEVSAKPHIGTDRLRSVVSGMRKEIERLGGEVRFGARLCGIKQQDGELSRVMVTQSGAEETIDCAALVLAIGQGARDTYQMLFDSGVMMAKKPFAVGLRIEHAQSMIDRAQFGEFAGYPRLGAAEYRLTAQSGDRGVYTFCMCPGGSVIASASQKDEVVVNGMSNFARNAKNANAAIVVQVRESDVPDDPLAGLRFQKEMEHAAFLAGGADGTAPASTVGAFLRKTALAGLDGVTPSYRPGVKAVNLWDILPNFVSKGIADGIHAFSGQLRGFGDPEAALTGVETRTSAPLRILRGELMESVSCAGMYPVGEGAGYAGGIVSAAIDGMKAAERIISLYAPPKRQI